MRSERALVRPIIWLLSVALILAGVSVAAPASADPVGGIAGAVTGTDSQPIEGATVTAYQWNDVEADWYSVATDDTDASGSYAIADLPFGAYRIGFGVYDSSGYLDEYWNDAATVEDADDITVAAGQTTSGKNAQLLLGGRVAGTITDPAGDPLLNGYVTAFRWDPVDESWGGVGDDYADADGAYELRGLLGGSYRLRFADGSGNGYLEEYWDGAVSLQAGTSFTVTPGTTVTGKDAQLAAPGHLSGTVTGTGDAPLEDVYVSAYRWTLADGWDSISSDYTDGDGSYDIGGLASGTYRLRFQDEADRGYLTEYWNDASDLQAADGVAVTAGETTADRDAQLTVGGHVAGTVTAAGDAPLEHVYVSIYQWDDHDEYWDATTGDYTDADGHYDIAGLHTGTYRLGFRDDSGDGFLNEYWDDAHTVETADDVDVTAGTTTSGKDAQLALGGTVTGAVSGDGGQPLDDVYVTAYRWDEADEYWDNVRGTYTGADGTYDLAGLTSGSYRLRFDDYSGGGYLTEFWNDAPTLGSATGFEITAGETTSGKNAQLLKGGHITGTVTGPDSQEVEEVRVRIYRWTEDEYWESFDNTYTDGDGRYDIGGLPTGSYRLQFHDQSGHGYLTEYWNDAATLETASTISVTAPQTVSGKNAQLSAGGHITGNVTGPADQAADDVYVSAYRWIAEDDSWESVSDDYTNANGDYDIGTLTAGTYRIEFDDESGAHLVTEYWNDAATLRTATDIAVVTGQTTSGKNAQLAASGSIAGTVTRSGDQPLEDINVTAYVWNGEDEEWDSVDSTYTNDEGDYTIDDLRAGSYRLGFRDYYTGFQPEFWDDAASLGTADDIAVAAGSEASGTDAELTDGGHITGTVTGPDDQPVQAVTVTAYRWEPIDEYWESVTSHSTDEHGAYDLNGLTTGDYRLRFRDTSGNGHLTEYWNDAATLNTATTIPVTVGTTVGGRDAQLAVGGRIEGTVTAPGGAPAEDVDVVVYRWDNEDEYWDSYDDAYTDEDGKYRLAGLPTDSYRLRFADQSGSGYLTEYWDDAETLDAATSISVTAGDTVAGRNAQLAAGGHITGTVTGADSEGIEDVSVTAYKWDADGEYWDAYDGVNTGASGQYDVRGLPTGTYRLRFDDDSGSGHLPEYWDDAPNLETADDIAVTAGATAGGKNAQLAAGAHLTGTVTGPGDSGLDDVYVTANRWYPDGEYWGSVNGTYTDESGHYDINGLPAGTYRLQFDDYSGNHYLTEYWDDAATLETANDIVVGAGATVTGKDAQLTDGSPTAIDNTTLPTISGTPQVGSTLIATTGTWEPAANLTFGYQWLVAGEPVSGASTSKYVPVAGDVGKTVRVEVTATRPGHTAGTATSAATNAVTAATVPAVANITPPAITGAPRVGTPVTATPGTWSPGGATLGYQWLVAGSPVPGATTSSYQPVAADAGKQLQVRVTATLAGHTAGTVTSTPVAVGKGTLKPTKKPKVTGKAKKNATLKVSPGSWSPKAKVTYQWYAGAKALAKATAVKLKLTGKTLKTVKGKAVSVLLTVTAPGYNTVTTKLKVSGKVKR